MCHSQCRSPLATMHNWWPILSLTRSGISGLNGTSHSCMCICTYGHAWRAPRQSRRTWMSSLNMSCKFTMVSNSLSETCLHLAVQAHVGFGVFFFLSLGRTGPRGFWCFLFPIFRLFFSYDTFVVWEHARTVIFYLYRSGEVMHWLLDTGYTTSVRTLRQVVVVYPAS